MKTILLSSLLCVTSIIFSQNNNFNRAYDFNGSNTLYNQVISFKNVPLKSINQTIYATSRKGPIVKGSFMAYDKQMHVAAGLTAGLTSYHIVYKLTDGNRRKSVVFSTLIATLGGVLKEGLDSGDGGTGFDVADLAHTAVGGLIGAITIDLISAAFRRDKNKKDRKINNRRMLLRGIARFN